MSYTVRQIRFSNRERAEEVLDSMMLTLHDYGCVTVEDYYEYCNANYECIDEEDRSYGWFHLEDAIVEFNAKTDFPYYTIHLPRPGLISERPSKKLDMVNHPPHYQSETGLETIDIIESVTFGLTGIEAVDTGNIVKYISRWKKKNGLQDLEKAKWYLEHLIAHIKKLEE